MRLISQCDVTEDASWWEAAQRIHESLDSVDFPDEGLNQHANSVFECSVDLAQKLGGIYIFVLEKVARKLSSAWDQGYALELLVRFVLPLGMFMLSRGFAAYRLICRG